MLILSVMPTPLKVIVTESKPEIFKEACLYDDDSITLSYERRYERCTAYYNSDDVMMSFTVHEIVETYTFTIDHKGNITPTLSVRKHCTTRKDIKVWLSHATAVVKVFKHTSYGLK